jgi:hypothetical protein
MHTTKLTRTTTNCRLLAAVEGRPLPTEVPPRVAPAPYVSSNSANNFSSSSSSNSAAGGSTDAKGMERLAGESDDQYIARQRVLRDEAAARMRNKFGPGGLGGGGAGSSTNNICYCRCNNYQHLMAAAVTSNSATATAAAKVVAITSNLLYRSSCAVAISCLKKKIFIEHDVLFPSVYCIQTGMLAAFMSIIATLHSY